MVAPRRYEYYRERSHHFLSLLDDVISQDEMELACEVLWGAAAHAIKSVAQRRRWEHGTHSLLSVAIERLIAETHAPPHLSGQYKMASDFHVGFYGDRQFRTEHLRLGKALIAEFIQTLESLP